MNELNPVFPHDNARIGIYLHIPFCRTRCHYCAFVTNPYDPELADQYLRSLSREFQLQREPGRLAELFRNAIADTIYFGGGTPSLIRPDSVAELVSECRSTFRTVAEPEITIELNPASVIRAALRELLVAGVNRVSLGVQSLEDDELKGMGRTHTARDALRTFEALRNVGFDNISVDLIAGFPGQSRTSFARSIRRVLELRPEHLSIYLLELKPGTKLDAKIRSGELPPLDDDLAAELYEDLCSAVTSAGYEQYELSNFAREGLYCRHNLKYWSDEIYLGFGAGAHGMTGRARYANVEDVATYRECIDSDQLPVSSVTEMTPEVRFKDALIMGLRLVKGLDLDRLGARYGVDARDFVEKTIGDLHAAGLFMLDGHNLRLTPRGRLLSNTIFSRWV
ncbi:MAG: radical SAM family heme chaperone HemW [Deltaproteobacteria bacterium]